MHAGFERVLEVLALLDPVVMQELDDEYRQLTPHSARIDRLRQDQAEARRVLESLRTRTEESSRVLLLAKDRRVRELERASRNSRPS